jgi:hypothetical protein
MEHSEKQHAKLDAHHVDYEGGVERSNAHEIFNQAGLNRKLLILNLWSCVSAFTYGFSAAVISSSLGQP